MTRKLQEKVYRGGRKSLSVTIHGQLRDKLSQIAGEQGWTLSATTDEFLYRGLAAAGRLRD